jgi:uncharacterized protein YodC (DUF2158 family)
MRGDVINEKSTGGPSIIASSYASETFLTGGIP